MAHGKETPRQKMIGMMYLVLTALLALNVSTSVLDAFSIIDEGLNKTAKTIQDKAVLAKLFTDIAPRFTERPGGYTRILKLGQRYGDASEMVFLELVERKQTVKKKKKKPAEKQEASET